MRRREAGHKLDHYLTSTPGQFVEFVPVCPEVDAGFDVPRELFRLVGDPENQRLITFKTKAIRKPIVAGPERFIPRLNTPFAVPPNKVS